MRFAVAAIAFLLVLGGGASYYFLAYPPVILRHEAEHMLTGFGKIVADGERSQIAAALQHMFAETAHVKLSITLPGAMGKQSAAIVQDFDREQFIGFVDNVLYSTDHYRFDPALQQFQLSADRKSADMQFSAKGGANDIVYYAGAMAPVRFNADIYCSGRLNFDAADVVMDAADCSLQLSASVTEGNKDEKH